MDEDNKEANYNSNSYISIGKKSEYQTSIENDSKYATQTPRTLNNKISEVKHWVDHKNL
jgi:hypothetical protein